MNLFWHKPLKSFCITAPLCDQHLNNLECIRGTGRPGASVSICIGCHPDLCTKVCPNGIWEVCNPYILPPGCYSIEAKERKGLRVRCSCVEFCIEGLSEGTIVIRYVDAETGNDILSPQIIFVPAGPYGEYFPPSMPGYIYSGLDPASAPSSGVISPGETVTIIFTYVQEPPSEDGTIVIRYVDAATGNEIRPPESFDVTPGLYGEYFPPQIEDYTYAGLDPISSPTSGNISSGEVVVIIFTYNSTAVQTGTIILRYLSITTSLPISEEDNFQVPAGSYGPYFAKNIPGYTYVSLGVGSAPQSGTIVAGDTEIIVFNYIRLS